MEWIAGLEGQTVGVDTAPLIYFIEEHPAYLEMVLTFFKAVEKGKIAAVTSTVTMLEVLVHPLRHNDEVLAAEYRDILLYSQLTTYDITPPIAELSAQLRSQHTLLRTPDAIQIATAVHAGATHFITNDIRLPTIPHLEIITLDSRLDAGK